MFSKPYINRVNYQSDSQLITCSGGINNVYPPEFIDDSECQDMYNFCLDSYPALQTKVGRRMLKNPGIAGTTINYFGVAGLNYLFYIQNKILKNVDGAEINSSINGSDFKHTYYKDGVSEYMILYGKGTKPIRFKLPFSSVNEAQYITLKDINGAEFEPDCMTYHKGRMFASKGDMLYFSALQNPMDWETNSDSGYIKITNAQGNITGLVSFDDKLIVFSQNNMHILYGDGITANSEANYFSLVDLDNSIGSYGNNIFKVHNGFLYWIYGESIYEYDGSSIRAIESATGSNGLTGGIKKYLEGLTYSEAQKVSIVGTANKVYFYFPNYQGQGKMLIFDQQLRKWTQEIQPNDEAEMFYISLADSFNSINFSQTPNPIYALTANGTIYEITGGDFEGGVYTKTYGKDEFIDTNNIVYRKNIPFYYKTKAFTDGGVSKKKVLDDLWIMYDLEKGGKANIRITKGTGEEIILENQLPVGANRIERILIPYQFKGVTDCYTIEIYGEGNIILKQIERKFRLKTR